MDNKLRELGLDFIGDIPWGSHICHFYDSKNDLLEILVPYFKAGLENNEYCIWITAEPLSASEAKNALKKEVLRLAHYFQKGQMEILGYNQWYAKSGKFNANEVLKEWVNKEKHAITKGFEGLRVTGNVSWLDKQDWHDFKEYENIVNHVIGDHQIQVICSYSLRQCDPKAIIDVVSNHQYSLIKSKERWKLIESSEKKKAEESLRASEKKYRSLFEAEMDAVILVDTETQEILDANKVALKIYGYTKNEILRLRAYDLSAEHAKTKRAIKSQGNHVSYRKHRKKNGSVFPVEINTGNYELQGKLVNLFTIKDLTKLEQSAYEIAKSRERYAKLFNVSNEGLLIADVKSKKFIDTNRKMCGMLGYTKNELLKLSVKDIHPKENLKDIIRIFNRQARGEAEFAESIPCRKKNGEVIFCDITTTKMEIDGVFYNTGHFTDVTQRVKAVRDLELSEQKFKTLFENSPDGIMIVDAKNHKIIDFNTAAHKNLGYSKEEFKKIQISDFEVYETPEQVKKHMQELLRAGCFSFETKHRKRNGKIIDVFVNSKVIKIHNKLVFMDICRDITIKKKNEEEIKQLVHEQAQELLVAHQKLEVSRRLADIGTLSASVAHELRNPLSVIKTSMYNIKRKRTNPEIDKNIDSVNKKITESDQIISNLLFYSKIQNPFMLKTNLYDTLDESIDYVSRYMPKSGVIKKNWSTHEELQIHYDPAQMGEVFSNILMNACQALSEKRGIVQISIQEDDKYIQIHFKDNGAGILKKHINRITEPFFTTKTRGIGLGLSVTAKIIELHHGKLEFASKRGVETTVTVKLPKK
ncbi:MAG: PAS domain S-box protein [bacterium]